jgi:hypothetical protein
VTGTFDDKTQIVFAREVYRRGDVMRIPGRDRVDAPHACYP